MQLKVCDIDTFNVSMCLNVNYDLEYIDVTVSSWNKVAHTRETKQFKAAEFSDALKYFDRQTKFLIGDSAQK